MSAFRDLLSPSRLTHIVDIGANPHSTDTPWGNDEPPYLPMLKAGLCQVTGFEPEHEAFSLLQSTCGPNESYLPYALGDGNPQTLNVCAAEGGMTSLLEPDPVALRLFRDLEPLSKVVERVPLDTRRLDDIREVEHLDLLKIDIQGGELAVFRHGRQKLAEAVAIQTEVSFVTLYQNEAPLGEVDLELRRQGFIPHALAAVKRWAIGNFVVAGDARRTLNQLLEADIVYVRDFTRADAMTDEQLKQLALIAHHCYGSFDLAHRCVELLEDRRVVGSGSLQRYLEILNARTPPWTPPLVWR